MERLAAGIDAEAERIGSELGSSKGSTGSADPAGPTEPLDLWAARDAYVDAVLGAEPVAAFTARWLGDDAPGDERHTLLTLLEAERWRLAMFASDGWFWDDPVRPETKHVLLAAARAARLIDPLAGTNLEARFVEDLTLFVSPSRRIDGEAIYREALGSVGQPVP